MARNNPDHYKLSGSRKEDPHRAAVSRARLSAQASWKRREAPLEQEGLAEAPRSSGSTTGDDKETEG